MFDNKLRNNYFINITICGSWIGGKTYTQYIAYAILHPTLTKSSKFKVEETID